jgi:Flp pilus assembly secretin CpaC
MKIIYLVIVYISLSLNSLTASPVSFLSEIKNTSLHKSMYLGDIDFIKFEQPVTLIHYLNKEKEAELIDISPLAASDNGYKEFMIKALNIGVSTVSFKCRNEIIKIEIKVNPNFEALELQLNELFGMPNSSPEERIKVLSSLPIQSFSINNDQAKANIFLKGTVSNAKNALLALSYAAKAVNDDGIKIFSNPGGNFRNTEDNSKSVAASNSDTSNQSFINYYENLNSLKNIENIHRDLVLASKSEKVISFIKVKEATRFKVKVRFLEMDSRYVDQFMNSILITGTGSDVRGAVGSPVLSPANIRSASNFFNNQSSSNFDISGLINLGSQVMGGNLASGALKLFDGTVLNLLINNLLEKGVLKLVNEFSLVTHSGEEVSLGKGSRFPIPRINNNVSGNTLGIEYIPIGFHGELRVSELDNNLIDVQLASRLTSAEASNNNLNGFAIPVFNEQFTNNGTVLQDGQEIIINSFLTESESFSKTKSPLARIIPFLGESHRKQNNKNILFIALKAEKEDFNLDQNVDDTFKHLFKNN